MGNYHNLSIISMKKLHKRLSTFALLMLFIATVPTVSAVGATPLRSILKGAPGETVKGTIYVQNTEDANQEIVLKKGDFRIREDESMQFLIDKDPNNKWSMQDWLTFDENNIVLEPGERKAVSYTIKIPQDAVSQSYYGVAFISSKTPDSDLRQERTVGISTNIAHLILLEVTGNLKTDVQLKDFTIDTKQYGEETQEVRFKVLLFNSGNTHTAPMGTITIKDENDNVIDQIDINKDKFNALPERQKTLVTIWNYKDAKPGVYTAYLDGKTIDGQTFSAQVIFTIKEDEDGNKVLVKGESVVNKSTTPAQQDAVKNMSVLYFLLFLVIITLAVKFIQRKKSHKHKKKFWGLFSVILILGSVTISSVFAQDYHNLDVNLTVEVGQISSFSFDGCWHQLTGEVLGWEFNTSDTTANLRQPGNRTFPSSGDQYDWYDVYGGDPEGDLAPNNTNAFGYDDCRFKVTAENWSNWNITLYSDAFDDGLGHEVPDMAGYNTAGFDYNIESEDPNTGGGTQYPLADGEHGFFIVDKSAGMVSPTTDTGSAAGVTYTTQKTFDATTCGDGNARPCYHFIPSSASPQTIFSSSSNVTDETFVTRFGMGADFSFPAGDYSMTVTLTLNTTP